MIKGDTSQIESLCVICFGSHEFYISAGCDHLVCRTCSCLYFNNVIKNICFDCSEPMECPVNDCNQRFSATSNLLELVFSNEEAVLWWKRAIIKTFIKNEVHTFYIEID